MIVGLTDRQEASFPRIGVMHKGEPAPKRADGRTERPGKDTNYFRLDSKFPDVMEAFRQAYGDKPQQLNVVLPHSTPEENFQTCKEHWVAGGLVHRCDGQTTSRLRMPDGSISKEPRPCPGQCKQVGRMMIIIPEILESTLRLAYITIQTTANNDLPRLMEELYAIYNIRGTLQGVPMVLRRVEEQISVPRSQSDPTRVRRSKWMLHIEAAPKFAKALLQSMQQEAIEAPTRRALGAQPRQLNAAPVHGQIDTSKVVGIQPEEVEFVAPDYSDEEVPDEPIDEEPIEAGFVNEREDADRTGDETPVDNSVFIDGEPGSEKQYSMIWAISYKVWDKQKAKAELAKLLKEVAQIDDVKHLSKNGASLVIKHLDAMAQRRTA